MTDLDRRKFIARAAGVLAANMIPGCASVAAMRVTPADGVVRLSLRDVPQLSLPGGYLKILPEGAATPIYVLSLESGEYAALSPICTHLGCTVDIEGPRLVCPCHGSTYDRAGQVLRGPAERALQSFPTTIAGDGQLIIELRGNG